MLDYSITLPGLLFILPLLLLLAALIKLDSPGPVIHRRLMMGQHGRPFYAFKFRTMVVNGDAILAQNPHLQAELAQNFKLKNDPRVTRIGHLLRKYSLDELPQLLNVLAGQMSLIGPRFVTPQEIAKYGPHGDTLLTVLPGLTGLWQVSGRSDTSYDERIRLDMLYIHHWSLALDLRILLRTPLVVLQGKGAY
ncbi:MAG: sugar transferase [Chloroflexi bacterium]|nr:sugar transferase [Chloroflexota bacterium]